MRRHTPKIVGGLAALVLAGCQSVAPSPAPAPSPTPIPAPAPEARDGSSDYNPFAGGGVGSSVDRSSPTPRPASPAPTPGARPRDGTRVAASNPLRPVLPGPRPEVVPRPTLYGNHNFGPIEYMVEGPVDANGNERSGLDRVGVAAGNILLDQLSCIPYARWAVNRGPQRNYDVFEAFWGVNSDGTPRKAPIGLADYVVAVPRLITHPLAEGAKEFVDWAYRCGDCEGCQEHYRRREADE